jgi:cytochrome c553
MNRWSGVVFVLAIALGLSSIGRSQEPQFVQFRPPPPPEQPVAFSHKLHISLGLGCTGCHTSAQTGDRATLPPTATCMTCHTSVRTDSVEIQKLTGFHEKKEDVPWRRVYRLPDYVAFSHTVHMSSGKAIACENCHGDVRELVQMQKLKDTSMAACIACHTENAAPTRCDSCHEPRG